MLSGPVEPGKLSLDAMREDLIRMEETIIFSLIERAQFKRNDAIYQPRAVTDKFDETFLDYFLIETERVHSRMRRYTSPDEHAFFPERLVPPSLPLLSFPPIVKPNRLNYNNKVKTLYLEKIVPGICKVGDDNQYGSSAQADIIALQAISKRVHYGKFVAEAKFQEKPQLFAQLIRNKESVSPVSLR
jgi:chorismate mutase